LGPTYEPVRQPTFIPPKPQATDFAVVGKLLTLRVAQRDQRSPPRTIFFARVQSTLYGGEWIVITIDSSTPPSSLILSLLHQLSSATSLKEYGMYVVVCCVPIPVLEKCLFDDR
jgi:hypothetical protein